MGCCWKLNQALWKVQTHLFSYILWPKHDHFLCVDESPDPNPLTNSLLSHCRWNLKAKILTHLETLFLRTSFPLDNTHSSTSLQTTICSLDSLILFDQTNVPTYFSSLNSTILCKIMEMYGQGRYTITLKNKNKKEMYSLTSIVPPLYSLSLSLIFWVLY